LRIAGFILAFAGACALGSLYGLLQGAWPFRLVEAFGAPSRDGDGGLSKEGEALPADQPIACTLQVRKLVHRAC
jgi:hypothetical protein